MAIPLRPIMALHSSRPPERDRRIPPSHFQTYREDWEGNPEGSRHDDMYAALKLILGQLDGPPLDQAAP